MIDADFHTHTSFSFDSTSNPEDMVEAAIQKGLKTICITDHNDYDFPDFEVLDAGETFDLDGDVYFRKMTEVKEKYRSEIDVRIGVEIGMQEHLNAYFHDFVNAHLYDFVIGSMHVIHGIDPYYPQYFKGRTDAEGYREAFQATIEMIKRFDDYDVLGHMDYVVRYGKTGGCDYSYQTYADYIDEILKMLISKGKGVEINTAGFKYGLGFAHPHPDILKRYKELGGEILTIGSDGHKPEHIAYDFNKVSSVLQSCGFKYYTEFAERRPIFKQLP